MNISEQAKKYAVNCHRDCNHFYDGKPYEFHLQMVVDAATEFIHLIPEDDRDIVIAGCWVHDTIEDCRQTYNDVRSATNEKVADIAYALTNEKGKNREERANEKYYGGIRKTPYAVFAKLCDRIANVRHSVNEKNFRKLEMYMKENILFEQKLKDERYAEMFECLQTLFSRQKG